MGASFGVESFTKVPYLTTLCFLGCEQNRCRKAKGCLIAVSLQGYSTFLLRISINKTRSIKMELPAFTLHKRSCSRCKSLLIVFSVPFSMILHPPSNLHISPLKSFFGPSSTLPAPTLILLSFFVPFRTSPYSRRMQHILSSSNAHYAPH